MLNRMRARLTGMWLKAQSRRGQGIFEYIVIVALVFAIGLAFYLFKDPIISWMNNKIQSLLNQI